MQRELLKNQNTLRIAGVGLIALAAWSIIKTVLFVVLDSDRFEAPFKEIMGELYDRKFIIILVFVALALDLIMRLLVGLRARKEGRGGKCGYVYLVFILLFVYMSVVSITEFVSPDYTSTSAADTAVNFIFELTNIYTCVSLLYSSFKVKKIRRLMSQEEA